MIYTRVTMLYIPGQLQQNVRKRHTSLFCVEVHTRVKLMPCEKLKQPSCDPKMA